MPVKIIMLEGAFFGNKKKMHTICLIRKKKVNLFKLHDYDWKKKKK